jgi:transposase InsO family protein
LAGIVRAIVYFGGGVPVGSIAFIQRISRENPLWGEDRIAQEMKLKLGIEHSASTIRRYMITEARSPSSTWRSFLRNHASEIYALDLTPQVMWDFSICYVLVLIDHRTRRLVHIGMTRNPTLDWVKQQVRDACPWEGPRFIIHDNDGIFGPFGRGQKFRCALDGWLWKVMGIRGIPTPVRAPDCNAICERVMGTLKREALNHFVFVSEAHLRRTLWEFRRFYNTARPHQGIGAIPAELDEPRVPLVLLEGGRLVGEPVLGGLHHDYRLAA